MLEMGCNSFEAIRYKKRNKMHNILKIYIH